MHGLERLPAVTARSILRFIQSIQSDKVAKGKGWFTYYSDEIKEMNTSHAQLIKKRYFEQIKFTTKFGPIEYQNFSSRNGHMS